ncbi:unnamed protein product [Sphagnum jensenii]|uniref:Methylenetetrahydrofolate reductase (NAD(P)H) n=1 Tax=Sphagnum jensenii TaxID=128206 RepID=A0ABP1AZP6_9BRYO
MQAVVMMANISFAGCAPAISQAFAKRASFKFNVRAGLFQENRLARFLELPASTSSSAFSLLQEGNGRLLEPIHGLISPDLPTKVTLLDFFYSLLSSNMFSSTEDKERQPVVDMHTVLRSGIQGLKCWQVRTVAAQTRTMAQIQELMVKRAEQIDNSGCGGALLLVSGGHTLREHWLTGKLTPADSFSMFRAAKLLQDSGLLPPGVQLWAVENPLTNSIDRLEKKIEAGAEAVILQPPLLPNQFAEWWSNAQQKGFLRAVPVVVGLPLISSSRNYEFWVHLTQASGKEADAVMGQWRRAEAAHGNDPLAMAAYCEHKSMQLIEYIKNLPDVAGIHVMPVTTTGWQQFQVLVSKGAL